MIENPDRPKNYDAVLGGTIPPPMSGAVLGGLPGVKNRLASADVETKIAALKQALNYGQAGLELLIQALQDESEQIQHFAFTLLRQRTEPEVREALREINPYRFLQCVHTLTGHRRSVQCVAFSPDSQTLASGGAECDIRLWNLRTGKTLRIFQGHTGAVNSVTFSPDGQILASGSDDKTIRLWQLDSSQETRIFYMGSTGKVYAVAISPDGQILASGNDDTTVNLWHLSTGQKIHTLTGHRDYRVTELAFSPDGQILASEKICTLAKHSHDLFDFVAFSPDGRILASRGGDKTIKIWRWD